jgi:hypothetical protein
MTLLAIFVVAAQAVSITPSPVGPATGRPDHLTFPACSGIRVRAPQLKVQPRDLTFSSRQVLDLQFRVRLRQDMEGDHLLQLKVLTPNGFLYQTITVPFVSAIPDPDPSSKEARRKNKKSMSIMEARAAAAAAPPPPPRYVPGFPRPLPVQRLWPVGGDATARIQYQLEARLPVAGTSITLSSLYGRWTVQSYLDGQPDACGPATSFDIEE